MNSRPVMTFAGKRRFDAVAETHGEPLSLLPTTTTTFADGDSRTASGVRLLMSGAVDGLAEELSIDKDLATNYGLEWTSSWPNETTYDLEVTGHSYFEAYLEVRREWTLLSLCIVKDHSFAVAAVCLLCSQWC